MFASSALLNDDHHSRWRSNPEDEDESTPSGPRPFGAPKTPAESTRRGWGSGSPRSAHPRLSDPRDAANLDVELKPPQDFALSERAAPPRQPYRGARVMIPKPEAKQ